MSVVQKTMMGVEVKYSTDGVSTLIFGSENNSDPEHGYRSHANPGTELIGEVLDKLKANNSSNTPIQLMIENGTFIVGDSAGVQGGGQPTPSSTAVAGASLEAAERAPASRMSAPRKPAVKRAPAKKGSAKKGARNSGT